MRSLENRWWELLQNLGVSKYATAQKHFRELQSAYSEPHRHYHTLAHLEQCFEVFDIVGRVDWLLPVAWGLFHHDKFYAVHRPQAEMNEHYSAQYSEWLGLRLGLSQKFLDHGKSLILVTRKHEAQTLEEQIICDVDLSILGQPAAVFDRYEEQVRREYLHVEWDTYRAVRSQILNNFLQKESIYHLPVYRKLFQKKAKANIRRSLVRLAA